MELESLFGTSIILSLYAGCIVNHAFLSPIRKLTDWYDIYVFVKFLFNNAN